VSRRVPIRALLAWALLALAAPAAATAAPPDAGPAPTAAPAAPGDTGSEALFDRAARAMAEGDHARAAGMFVHVADTHPDHPLAAEALFSAARLHAERLAQPARALALYRRLVERYPHSRTALAAERRAADIERQLEPGGQSDAALARFTEILQRFSASNEAESIAAVEALLAEHPTWPGTPRALLWLAEIHRRAGRTAAALARYLQAARDWPDSEENAHAWRGAGDMAARLDRFDEALAYYHSMPVTVPAQQRSRDDALAALARDRWRARLYTACFALVALVFLGLIASLRHATGSARASLRALARPPTEALYMLPIAALLLGVAFTGHEAIAPAVAIMCGGALALAWLSGAALDHARARGVGRHRLRVLAHTAAVSLAVLALCYIAVQRGHLVDMLLETVRFGPEL
jgi:tetratricopeptide (TPR) repeat protein